MLELKRKLKQGVCLGRSIVMRVEEFGVGRVKVNFENTSLEDATVMLRHGLAYHCEIEGHKVYIHLRAVDRGEAVLGFDAPRELAIDREEVRA